MSDAKVQIADVIVPSVFSDYVTMRTAALSAIRNSGIAATDPVITARANGGGQFVNLPFWNDLSGDDEVLSDSGSLTKNKITAEEDVAVKLFRGNAWSANDMAGWVAGDDPMLSIADGVAAYWARKEQATLISILTGIFGSALASTHVHDVTGASTALSAEVILDSKQLLGDAADRLTALVIHSAKYTALQKALLIDYIGAEGDIKFPAFMGYRVIVDDACPVDTGNYTSYLFGAGAFAYADVGLGNAAIETDRDILAGDDVLVSRRAYVLHPRGVKWNSTANPANSVLDDAAKWTKVYDDKQIRIVKIVSK